MNIQNAFAGAKRVFLDTAPIVYYLERNPSYSLRMDVFFKIRREHELTLVTSPITLAECLVHPLRRGMNTLAEQYRNLIVVGEATEFQSINDKEAVLAASLRAEYSISLADSFQLAVAIRSDCQVFLTNDRALNKIETIKVWVLDDLEP